MIAFQSLSCFTHLCRHSLCPVTLEGPEPQLLAPRLQALRRRWPSCFDSTREKKEEERREQDRRRLSSLAFQKRRRRKNDDERDDRDCETTKKKKTRPPLSTIFFHFCNVLFGLFFFAKKKCGEEKKRHSRFCLFGYVQLWGIEKCSKEAGKAAFLFFVFRKKKVFDFCSVCCLSLSLALQPHLHPRPLSLILLFLSRALDSAGKSALEREK